MVQLPISPLTNSANDNGIPFCLQRPENAEQELKAFKELADIVSTGLLKYQYGQQEGGAQKVTFESENGFFDLESLVMSKSTDGMLIVRLFSDSGALQKRITPAMLRSRDPKSGEVIQDSPFLREAEESVGQDGPLVTIHKTGAKQSPSLIPNKVSRRGRYGFAVEWADGATIIYSMISVAKTAGATLKE